MDSDESADETFSPNLDEIKPYQFEPMKDSADNIPSQDFDQSDSEGISDTEQTQDHDDMRMDNTAWYV